MTKLRTVLISAVLAVALIGLAAAPANAAPAAAPAASVGTLTAAVTGTYTDATGRAGTFTGTYTPSRFDAAGDALTTTGTVAGTLTGADGTSRAASAPATFAVTDLSATCQILDLNLAPLDLNLLGLTVHLDRVHLNITAVPGAGNLLGNLLCAVAGLLDGVGTAAQIAALLNQILALLGL